MGFKLPYFFAKHKSVTLLSLHCLVLITVYIALSYFNYLTGVPNNNNLLNWDASFYFDIKEHGYRWLDEKPSELAFCPLFPWFWKISCLDAIGMSFLNAFIFMISMLLLLKEYKIQVLVLLLILGFPSFIFFYIPYSEAIFFLLSTTILIGYRKGISWLIYTGFFLASITKASAFVFIAAIIFVELTTWKDNLRGRIPQIIGRVLACLSGTAVVVMTQRYQTGKWFNLLEAQKFFRRTWQLPGFPLTTIQPQRTLGFDSIAFSIGVIALIYCIIWCANSLNRKVSDANPDPVIAFSTFVLAAIVIIDTFFTYSKDGHTSIWSINRHILCTPFVIIFLNWLFEELRKKSGQALLAGAVVFVNIFFTGLFEFPLLLVFYVGFFGSLALFLYLPKYKNYWLLFYVIEVVIQLQTFDNFLYHRWIA
ncbi:MAG: hypothetical protein V4553_16220 [Bacteroidota bacterium]